MNIRVETPPTLKGGTEQQLTQLTSYLFRLSELLNIALNDISSVQANSSDMASDVDKGGAGNDGSTSRGEAYEELRSLIINTADVVNASMKSLRTELESQYAAMSSEWGNYQENMTNTITATANGILQEYGYDAAIETLQEQAAGFSEYRINTEGYIRSGFIDYDENNVPIVGIAIGNNLSTTTVVIDGQEYEQVDSTQSCAFYTSDRVSFRINGKEAAYVSNGRLYITDATITGTLTFGNYLLSHTYGFTIQSIGG